MLPGTYVQDVDAELPHACRTQTRGSRAARCMLFLTRVDDGAWLCNDCKQVRVYDRQSPTARLLTHCRASYGCVYSFGLPRGNPPAMIPCFDCLIRYTYLRVSMRFVWPGLARRTREPCNCSGGPAACNLDGHSPKLLPSNTRSHVTAVPLQPKYTAVSACHGR